MLLLDGPGLSRQLLLGMGMLLFLVACTKGSPVPRRQIVAAVLIASLGEVVLSLGWKLYSYHHFLIPLYVPPGHGLFYALAAESSHQPRLRALTARISGTVVVVGTLIALCSFIFWSDVWGGFWWLVVAVALLKLHDRLLLSACVVFTLLLEWCGTFIGNWRWAPLVPFVSVRSANPPAGVGIFYVLLDLLVIAACAGLSRLAADRAIDPLKPLAPVAGV